MGADTPIVARTLPAHERPVELDPEPEVLPGGQISALPQSTWQPSEDEIRIRAYHRYLERGGGHGRAFEDWLEAERELKLRG